MDASSSSTSKEPIDLPQLPLPNQPHALPKRKSPHGGLIRGELGNHNLRPTRDAVLSSLEDDKRRKKARFTYAEDEATASYSSSKSPASNRISLESQQGSLPMGQIIAEFHSTPSAQFNADQLQVDTIFDKATLSGSQTADVETGLDLESPAEEMPEVNCIIGADDRSSIQSQPSQPILALEGNDGDTDISVKSARPTSEGSQSSGQFEDFPQNTPSTSYTTSGFSTARIPHKPTLRATDIGGKGEDEGEDKVVIVESERDFRSSVLPYIAAEHLKDETREGSEQDELGDEDDELLKTITEASEYPQLTVAEQPLRETQTCMLQASSIPQIMSPSSTSDDNGSSPHSESVDQASPLASVKAPELDQDTGIFSKMAVIVFPKGPRRKYDKPEYRRPAIVTLDTAADVNAISTIFAQSLTELGLQIRTVSEGFEVAGIGGHIVKIDKGVELTCEWQGRSKVYIFYLIESDAFELLWGHTTIREEGIYKKESSGQLFIATKKPRKKMTEGTTWPFVNANLPNGSHDWCDVAEKKQLEKFAAEQRKLKRQNERDFAAADDELRPDYSAKVNDSTEQGQPDAGVARGGWYRSWLPLKKG
jgi:hypothetical protein